MLRGPPDTGLSHPFTHDVYSLLATSNSQASSTMMLIAVASAAGNKKRLVKIHQEGIHQMHKHHFHLIKGQDHRN